MCEFIFFALNTLVIVSQDAVKNCIPECGTIINQLKEFFHIDYETNLEKSSVIMNFFMFSSLFSDFFRK